MSGRTITINWSVELYGTSSFPLHLISDNWDDWSEETRREEIGQIALEWAMDKLEEDAEVDINYIVEDDEDKIGRS